MRGVFHRIPASIAHPSAPIETGGQFFLGSGPGPRGRFARASGGQRAYAWLRERTSSVAAATIASASIPAACISSAALPDIGMSRTASLMSGVG